MSFLRLGILPWTETTLVLENAEVLMNNYVSEYNEYLKDNIYII